jgi:disulfide bond formation protein DsbB
MTVDQASWFFATLALAAWTVSFLLGVSFVVARVSPAGRQRLAPWRDEASRLALAFAWAVAAVCFGGSLYYSEVAHFVPCTLCWYQRIAMYPLVLVLGVAALTRDRRAWRYVLPLAVVGGAISVYHYQLQAFPSQGHGACDPAVPCTLRYVEEYGFISIPFMALSGFVLISALALLARARMPERDLVP